MFSLPLKILLITPALISCPELFSMPSGSLTPNCIAVNSAIKRAVDLGQPEQAKHLALEAITKDLSHLEPVCAGILMTNAAVASSLSGSLDEAQRFAEQSIEYLKVDFPDSDPVYLRPLHLLAAIYLTHGQTYKARKTLWKMERVRVTSPQDRAMVLGMSASVLQREGRRHRAEQDYLAALQAIAQAGQQNSGEAAALKRSLAYLYVEQQRYDEALRTVDAALAALQSAKDAVPLDRIQILNVRATALVHQRRWREAEIDLSDAVALVRDQPNLDAIQLEAVLTNYATVLHKLHRKEARSFAALADKLHSEAASSRQTVDVTELRGLQGDVAERGRGTRQVSENSKRR